jgi:hypothetical protein
MLSTNLQLEKTDVWTLSNYQSVLLDMMAACAYMNSESLFLTLRFVVLWMSNNDKFDNLSSLIVVLRQFFTRRIALNERSLDAEDTGIVINILKIA